MCLMLELIHERIEFTSGLGGARHDGSNAHVVINEGSHTSNGRFCKMREAQLNENHVTV